MWGIGFSQCSATIATVCTELPAALFLLASFGFCTAFPSCNKSASSKQSHATNCIWLQFANYKQTHSYVEGWGSGGCACWSAVFICLAVATLLLFFDLLVINIEAEAGAGAAALDSRISWATLRMSDADWVHLQHRDPPRPETRDTFLTNSKQIALAVG